MVPANERRVFEPEESSGEAESKSTLGKARQMRLLPFSVTGAEDRDSACHFVRTLTTDFYRCPTSKTHLCAVSEVTPLKSAVSSVLLGPPSLPRSLPPWLPHFRRTWDTCICRCT